MKKYIQKNKLHEFLKKRQGGQAMLISVVSFLFISLSIVTGLVSPTVKGYRVASVNINSKQSYFLAESGVEDAIYRIKRSKPIGTSETITIGSNSVITAITTNGNVKEIETEGDIQSGSTHYERHLNATLSTASGISFNYGVQVGQGGLYVESANIIGNVYANGPVTGTSSAVFTGTVISGNSGALSAVETNGSLSTPEYSVSFAQANGTQDIAQSFQLTSGSETSPVTKIQFYIKKVGTPSDRTLRIMTDASGSPGSTQIASGTLTAASVATSYGWVDIPITATSGFASATTYWLVLDGSTSSSNYYTLGANSAGYADGLGKIGQYGSTWNNTTPSGLDYYFKIFTGGLTGLIASTSGSQWNQLHVGTVSGTAQAHTVNYTNSTGLIYCQTGTGNNKSCTAQTDPVYAPFAISDTDLSGWQADAVAGGTYTGNYTVGWAGASLGAKKIVGNLTVSGGGTLTLSGTIWVTGNITVDGGGTIKLSSSYGSNDGVIIVDGTASTSGGGHLVGSGTNGSYIMLYSTSPRTDAVTINGGSGATIFYAPYGTITISGGADLKAATAYRIIMNGGSDLTYESGIANNQFSSGPGGTYSMQSWKEVE